MSVDVINHHLPTRLRHTARHFNCPDLPIVDVMSRHDPSRVVRPMLWLGTLRLGTVAMLAMPRENGCRGLHTLPIERIEPHPSPRLAMYWDA